MSEVKKAIIPLAGVGTRFLPLSKSVSKEFWPLVDQAVVYYIVKEAIDSGIEEIIFVLSPGNKKILDYLKPSPKIEKLLKDRKKDDILTEFKKFENYIKDIKFSYVFQKEPLGDGHAILQAAKLVKDEPVAVLFADDVFESAEPALLQLKKVFKTCQKPIIGLYKQVPERICFYGCADIEKIANRFYKIKKLVEKPKRGEEPSSFVVPGKYILTPEVFQYLKKEKPNFKGEIILAHLYENMINQGKLFYGYELDGKWLECGNKLEWLKSNIYLSLKDPRFGPEIKKYIKENKLI